MLNDYTSYTSLYAVGTVGHRGLASFIVKSPYLRRLQALSYFSDLADVLQTTYEQHTIGTSELMKNYPKSILKIKINFYSKLLAAMAATSRTQQSIIKEVMEEFMAGYSARIESISVLPSLIGMLAAPPFRRPLGTDLKRTMMKVMNTLLRDPQKSGEIKQKLKEIYDSLIMFHKNILFDCNIEGKECRFEIIEPLKTLIMYSYRLYGRNDANRFYNDVKNIYCKIFMNIIEDLYSSRIYPYTKTSNPLSVDYYLPSFFLLRYRTLGTFLGAGYGIKVILEKLHDIINNVSDVDYITKFIDDVYDALIALIEAMMINNTATITITKELGTREFKCNSDNTFKLPVVHVLGVPEIIYPEGTLLVNHNLGKFDKNLICNNPCNSQSSKCKNKLVLLDKKIASNNNVNILDKLSQANDIIFKEYNIPCCILVKTNINSKSGLRILYKYLQKDAQLIEQIGALITSEVVGHSGIVKLTNNQQLLHLLQCSSLHIRPFLTHFKMNLIQADMLPSAYQLDLLHRLDKDINIGIRVDYENLDDIVLNLDSYSLLTYMTLASIYTYLFSDTATISKRIGILEKMKEDTSLNCTINNERIIINIKKFDIYIILYYYSILKTFHYLHQQIKEIYEEIEDKISDTHRDVRTLLRSAMAYSNFLKGLTNLLEMLLDNYILYKINSREIRIDSDHQDSKKVIECLIKTYFPYIGDSGDRLFLSYVDSFVQNALLHIDIDNVKKATDMSESEKDGTAKISEEDSRILIHGKIPVGEIYMRDEFMKKIMTDYYNALNYITIPLLQNLYGPVFSELIKQKIQNKLGNSIIIEDIVVHVPIQGVLKFYFHLPERVTFMPRIVDALPIELANVKQKNATLGTKYCQLIRDLTNITTQTKSNLIEYIQKGLLTIKNAPSVPFAKAIIMPDLAFWDAIGPVTRSSEFEKFDPSAPKSFTRIVYRNVNIVYSLIARVPSTSSSATLPSIRMIQSATANAISELLSNIIGVLK